jgi:hypothetical protein
VTLSEESVERITLLYQTALHNGSLVTAQEVSCLLSERASAQDVAEAVISMPALRSRFELKGGFLTERGLHQDRDPTLSEAKSRSIAKVNLSHATNFARLLRSNTFEMVAVSGSTSYGSAAHSKDLDFFCVSRTGHMWISLTKGLLMARAYGVAHRNAPDICFSYVMDEAYARSTFESRRDPLFARDAIETKVLKGRVVYRSLMGTASWISEFFPRSYDASAFMRAEAAHGPAESTLGRVLNRFLFFAVGHYLQLKSKLLTGLLAATERHEDLFKVHAAEDHLTYESRRYSKLKETYSKGFAVLAQRSGPSMNPTR